SIDAMQHKAVALGTSCAMIGNFLFLSLILYRRLSGYSLLYLGRGVFKVCAASAVMWLWLHLAREVLGGRSVPDIAALVFLLVSAVMVYGGTLYGMRLHELTVLVDKVRARVSRQKDEKK
ncbi:MAG: murein biosynthesis integral membrane protein MurJ, partial [Desulfobulbaceae bacterium]|nr:murein biosynthesis integral membrane protein MurJ [Desulfobulbaceae bacterium]